MQSKLKLYSIPEKMLAALRTCRPVLLRGRVTEVTGTLITAQLPGVKVGELCKLYNSDTGESLDAEIIGFKQQQAILTPFGDTRGLSIYTEVCPTGTSHQVGVGRHLLGKVLDGLGNPFTAANYIEPEQWYPIYRDAPAPMQRKLIEKPLSLGVRAIDGLLTCAEGQRMGIFAAAGGGKSTLLASLIRGADVDVIVLALIGERGRDNLTWYYDGSVLYVFKNSEVQSKLIKLENTTIKALQKALIDAGIWDKKFSWKPDPHHQLVYVSGPPRYIELVMQTVSALEQQATMQQEQGVPLAIQVFSLKYASAVDRIIKYRDEQIQVPGLATILANMVSAAEISQINNDKIISQKPNGHKAMTQSEPSINAIIVRDLPERMPIYQRLIHSLDKPTARIEVALSIIDVNADNLAELGIDWGVGLKAGQHHQINIASTLTQAASPVLGSLLDKQGLNYLVAKVSLLQSQGIAQVVSKPTLLTQENTQAIIDHNETYYIKVNGERVAELKGITYGTLLQMTPRVIQIGDKPEIHLVLHIEDGNQKPNSSGVDGIPTINRTIIDTVARVEQGQSLVIGGIFRDEIIKTSRKVPLLGDIPLLGALFRSNGNQTRRAVRIFIVEPKIIDKGLAKYLSVGNQRSLAPRLLNIDEISNQSLPLRKILNDAQCQPLEQAKRIQSRFKQANKEAIIATCNKGEQSGWRVIDLSCGEDQIECIYKAYK